MDKTPAEIKYCRKEEAWVFTHEHIHKSKHWKEDDDCNWLARCSPSLQFDLLSTNNDMWDIWTGVVTKGRVEIISTRCQRTSDCNLNGKCIDGQCSCHHSDEVRDSYVPLECVMKIERCRYLRRFSIWVCTCGELKLP